MINEIGKEKILEVLQEVYNNNLSPQQGLDKLIGKDDNKQEELEPILVGYLNKEFGYNGFKQVKKGTPVYEYKEKYFFYIEFLNSNKTSVQYFYKDDLVHCIDFK